MYEPSPTKLSVKMRFNETQIKMYASKLPPSTEGKKENTLRLRI